MSQKNIIRCLQALIILFAGAALAQEGHEEHAAGLTPETLKVIIYQAINVIALIAGLIYFLKTPAKQFFLGKRASFLAAAEKSQAARKAAEDERLQIQVRLNKLESTADESISRARAEAADMKKQMLAEAAAISKRIRDEAHTAARLEVERAKHHLREDLIKESFSVAQAQMNSKVSIEDHSRLQGEFINNIQAVQR